MGKFVSVGAITRTQAALDHAMSYTGDGSPEAIRTKLDMLTQVSIGLCEVSRHVRLEAEKTRKESQLIRSELYAQENIRKAAARDGADDELATPTDRPGEAEDDLPETFETSRAAD